MASGGGHRGRDFAVTSALFAVAAAALLSIGLSREGHPPGPRPTAEANPGTLRTGGGRLPMIEALARSAPTSIAIPSIGVSAPRLVWLGRARDGSVEVPTDYHQPGWYQLGPAPGQPGAAVLVGHVDSRSGPAVFWRLGKLHHGSTILIRRNDGRRLTFMVYGVASYPKNRFPTAKVYGSASHRAELRLITCGGTFDHRTGHYLDNTVVYATLTAVR